MDINVNKNINFTHQIPYDRTPEQKAKLSKTLVELSEKIKASAANSKEFQNYMVNLTNKHIVDETKFETLVEVKPIFDKKQFPEIYSPKKMTTKQKIKKVFKYATASGALLTLSAVAEKTPVMKGVLQVAVFGMAATKFMYDYAKIGHWEQELAKEKATLDFWKSKIMLGESYEIIKNYVQDDPVLNLHVCPISQELLFAPVVTSDFRTYNLETLNRYISLQKGDDANFVTSMFWNSEKNEHYQIKEVKSPFRSNPIKADDCYPDYPRMTVIKHRINHILNEELKGEEFKQLRIVFNEILKNINDQFEIGKKACDKFFEDHRKDPKIKLKDLKEFKKAYEMAFDEVIYVQSKAYGTPEEFNGKAEMEEETLEEYFPNDDCKCCGVGLQFGYNISKYIAIMMMQQNVGDTLTWKIAKNYVK